MGSRAYGIENKDSDWDYYGMCMIPRKNIFPNEYGMLLGLDSIPTFNQWEKKNFIDSDSGKDMSFVVYGIVRYAYLLMQGNPNIIESLFTPRECVIYSTPIGEKFRNNRQIFISKDNFVRTRAYAFSQLKKLDRVPEGKRKESYDIYGYDVKYAAHAIRLISNCRQMIENQTIDLRRDREMVKAIRRGEWTLSQIRDYCNKQELYLEDIVNKSNLPPKPNINTVRSLLLSCIKEHYQDVSFVNQSSEHEILQNIKKLVSHV
jgi:predicted nucleotidyltransferase